MMSKKILFILHLPPPVHGAAVVGEYIKNSPLVNDLFECRYFNLSTSTSLNEIGKGGLAKIKTLLQLQYRLFKALRETNFDLCYMTLTSHGPGFYKDLFVVALLKLFGKKIVYHFHNKGISSRQHRLVDNILYQFAFKNTKSILLSPYLYPDICKYVSPQDVFYCPNGIPGAASSVDSKATEQTNSFNILFLSNMMEEKGVWILLEACQLLKKRGVNFTCHFIGAWSDIGEDDFNQRLDQLDLQQEVIMHGKKYHEEKERFFDQADVFVFPTYYHNEAFSLVILEAMQKALPIISTREGGIPDMVVDEVNGFLVNKRDPRDLADKIQHLYEQPELRLKMGASGKERFYNFYTLDIFERNFTQILETL